jgi:hypothetical protein
MNSSYLFAEAKYESAAKESKEALNNLLELDPEMQVISPQVQFLTAQVSQILLFMVHCYVWNNINLRSNFVNPSDNR